MKLLKNVVTVGFFTSLSRVLGMVREMFLSNILGASWITDTFVVAFKFPNFFRRFFAEGAFNAAFVPQFAGTLEKEGEKKAQEIAQNTFSVMAFSLTIFCLFIIIFTPVLIYMIAPGFVNTPEKLDLSITLVRLTFPFILFVSLSALLAGILNSYDRFAAASATPIILNIFMIIALMSYSFFDTQPVIAVSISVTLAGFTQLLWLYAATRRLGVPIRLAIPTLTEPVRKILKLMIPGAIGAGVMQINLLVDMILASFLQSGSISYLYYADRLNQLPLSMFGVAVGTALLPELSRLWRADKKERALKIQETALLMSLQLTIPAAVALVCLARPLIALLYGHGQFGIHEINQTAPALAAFSLGLPAYVASRVFSSTFFAVQNTTTPVKVGVITLCLNIILNLILMQFYAHIGMAIATSMAAWVNVLLMGYLLMKKGLFHFSRMMFIHLIKIVLLSVCMGWLVITIQSYFIANHGTLETLSLLSEMREMVFMIIIGIGFYFVSGFLLGFGNFLQDNQKST
ncbi:MAG: murein biosynthesis integral membrane protein MurJ [Alphaproteobacteria bacterium CG_4_10_14_0_8_um_filter_37_21]|nr:MAG: murein biosynthesis integral membrane protein MurJ [Alphaproteobacteria bacterium CG_4_10_14_0_8_um_filter_37_21]